MFEIILLKSVTYVNSVKQSMLKCVCIRMLKIYITRFGYFYRTHVFGRYPIERYQKYHVRLRINQKYKSDIVTAVKELD